MSKNLLVYSTVPFVAIEKYRSNIMGQCLRRSLLIKTTKNKLLIEDSPSGHSGHQDIFFLHHQELYIPQISHNYLLAILFCLNFTYIFDTSVSTYNKQILSYLWFLMRINCFIHHVKEYE